MTDEFILCIYCGEEVEFDELGIFCEGCRAYISRFAVKEVGWDYGPDDRIYYYQR